MTSSPGNTNTETHRARSTPSLWYHESDGDGLPVNHQDQYIVAPDGGGRIATCHGADAHRNAAVIARACQFHADLVLALGTALGLITKHGLGEKLASLADAGDRTDFTRLEAARGIQTEVWQAGIAVEHPHPETKTIDDTLAATLAERIDIAAMKQALSEARDWILATIEADEEQGALPNEENDAMLDRIEASLAMLRAED